MLDNAGYAIVAITFIFCVDMLIVCALRDVYIGAVAGLPSVPMETRRDTPARVLTHAFLAVTVAVLARQTPADAPHRASPLF